ncbi:DUF1471 domain-containing protein [Pectobacterium punjabense]|uniref:DUF1471 domain-containing protein n=1 Tax=Pectobacterium punjabense TaxID=2108399 RepID=A0ABX6L3U2_9GAMM|nr:DUF1471 domain-containing protein [Pectobacterium punjabense]MBS4429288.1 DUF1471 domain-containing protein [Pectobacterium punjabense]PTA65142.1 DUF1471 domain-containing protein [Pectobacterium punjabense]QJA20984.1 DUF1471 domain-containing protein [Pectobacterium punjabense]
MKKLVLTFTVILMLPFSVFAESITATASTLDEAENIICTKAEKLGSGYKIISVRSKNDVYIIARLVPKK